MLELTKPLFVAAVIALGGFAAPAQAQLARTWVSSFGNDANNCDRPTPCRTFQHAHDKTLPLGEISVLDPGGYGALTITKGISIINDGVGEAGLLVSGGTIGILIEALPTDHVSLRGITVKGIGFGGVNGILFKTAASLTLENCVVRNHDGDGIQMLGDVPANSFVSFTLSNTFVTDNGGNGIYIQPTGTGHLSVLLNRVETYNNSAHGFAVVGAFSGAAVVDSIAAHNGGSGFGAFTQAALTAKRSVMFNNRRSGFLVDHAFAALSETVASGNTNGDIECTSSFLNTYQDNLASTFSGNNANCQVTGIVKF